MGERLMRNAGFFFVSVVICAAIVVSCRRDSDFESPYMPGSPGYAGDEWTRDADGNGVADSLDKYSPTCKLPPKQCLENSKVISKISGVQNTLNAREMLLWLGDPGLAPSLVWAPAEGAVREYLLTSSDTTTVKVQGTRLVPVSIGSAQITVTVPGADSLTASFITRVVSAGKKVQSVSSSDLTIKVGEDIMPSVTWLPADADHRNFFLTSDRSDVARVSGQTLHGLLPGKAGIVLQTLDGGYKTAFTVNVIEGAVIVSTDSIWAEDMFLVKGDSAEAPTLHWTPEKVTFKLYRLASFADTSVIALNKDQTKIVPKGAGTVRVILLVLDGSRGGCDLVVTVASQAVPVKGISASNLILNAGADPGLPKLTWLPLDATNRKYSLVSRNESVAMAQGSMIAPLSMGAVDFIITTQDGGFQDSFTVSVGRPDTANHVDSVGVQNLSVGIGSEKRPVTTWFPDNAGNRTYVLSSADTTIAKPSGENVQAVKVGSVKFTLTASDGGRRADFMVTVFPPETKVQMVKVDTMFMVVDQELSPTLTWTPSGATNLYFSLVSLDTSYTVIVSGTRVKAKAVGITNVQLRSADGPVTTFTVVITAKPVNLLNMTAQSVYMNLGDAPKDPVVIFNPQNATNKNITLKSLSGTSVITISAQNRIEAVGPGKAPLTLVSNENTNITVICTVTVSALVKSVSAKDDTLRLGQADRDVFTLLTWNPPNATDKSFALTSNDTNIVRPNGKFYRAVGGGKTTVIVKAMDGSNKADTFNVWVKIPVTSVVAKDYTMKMGDPLFNTHPLFTFNPTTASNKNWYLNYASPTASPAPSTIVTILGGWQFQPVAPGTTRIIVMSMDNNAAKDTFDLTVIQPVASISIADMTIKRPEGDKEPIIAWTPTNATNKGYTLTGGTAGVASVVANKIHPIGFGTTSFVVLTADEGKTDTFKVFVTVPLEAISVADSSMSRMDEDLYPTVIYTPADAPNKGYTLNSSDTDVVTIVNGKIHPVTKGTAVLTITSTENTTLKSTFVVTVTGGGG
ncbi:MAG: hypothetical protein M3Y08_06980 [Fibrobacterota bacterium]|nr:hypothetical protein [Fibrobacterota bacterium]